MISGLVTDKASARYWCLVPTPDVAVGKTDLESL